MVVDGASWFFNGGFGPACCKAWPLPHLRAVVSGRGPRLGPMLMADFLNTAGRTYDEMKRNAGVLVREMVECHGDTILGGPFGSKLEIVVAGWSETTGPDAFVISTHGDNPAVAPWTVLDCGPVMMTPGDPEIQQTALAAMPAGVTCADDMDPARDGLAIVMAQRAGRVLADGMSVVGAFVQLTTVTQEGISTRILHSWPEEWGEPMVPPAETEAAA